MRFGLRRGNGGVVKFVRSLPALPKRAADCHKGDCGRLIVVAGSPTMLGAAVLCATAALRAGAGLVQVCLPAELTALLPLAQPCATTLTRGKDLDAALARADAVVVGPGLGPDGATRRLVQRVLAQAAVPVVLDADALNVLAPLRGPIVANGPVVITPHAGEAARLLGITAAQVQQDRRAALAQLCERSHAVVLLKGSGTLVGDGQRAYRNRTGHAGLATPGSGDVLAGLLGTLLAQGVEPLLAAAWAARLHGLAADRLRPQLGQRGLLASDLPLALAELLR